MNIRSIAGLASRFGWNVAGVGVPLIAAAIFVPPSLNALGAERFGFGAGILVCLGCILLRKCHEGGCTAGIATQREDLVKRLNPDIGAQRLVNLLTAWNHEIKEMMGGMGINSIESLKGNRLMLRGIGLTEAELDILGIEHAGR